MSEPSAPSRSRSVVEAFTGGLSTNFWKLWSSSAAANLADGITVGALGVLGRLVVTEDRIRAAEASARPMPPL